MEASGTQPKSLLAEKKGKRPYKIAATILAVLVLHFTWQFSFVQKENLRIAEDSLNVLPLDVLPIESLTNKKNVEISPNLAEKKTEAAAIPKSVMPVKFSPIENKSPQSQVKKKAARDPKAERLRRAEKLLTGF